MKQKRGIALITVLIVSVLMMILLSSFIQVNQRHFGILNSDLHHVAASEAARSAFDYSLYKLERNKAWGRAPFEGKEDKLASGYLEIEEVKGKRRIEGRVTESDAEFSIDILNNIEGVASSDGVSQGMCRLRITAQRGTARISREAVLGTAPLFDGAVVASKKIGIEAESVTVSSADPLRNRLRSKGNIVVPDYEDSSFAFSSAEDATEKGILWAQGGIIMGGKDLEDSDHAEKAVSKTGGQFLPHAETHYDVYDLQIGEVRSNKTTVEVDSGVYVFGRRLVTYASGSGDKDIVVPVLERRDWALDDHGNLADGDVQEVWYLTSSLPDDARSDWVKLWGDLPEAGRHPMDENQFTLDAGVHVHFNSLDPDTPESAGPPAVVLNSDVNLQVEGDFGIASNDGDYRPTVMFRDPETGEVYSDTKGKVVSGSITALAKRSKDGKVVKPGSIYIDGFISGNGKLLAEGDVTLKNSYANVSSDEQSDLSIYAGGDVRIKPQKARRLDDKTVFKYADVDGTTAFRGLVFAGGNVHFEADKSKHDEPVEKADLYIEGAVVARDGQVLVSSGRRVHFRYNPEFVDSILNLRGETRVRLERVVWKET